MICAKQYYTTCPDTSGEEEGGNTEYTELKCLLFSLSKN
jgi:hypothetical protein